MEVCPAGHLGLALSHTEGQSSSQGGPFGMILFPRVLVPLPSSISLAKAW